MHDTAVLEYREYTVFLCLKLTLYLKHWQPRTLFDIQVSRKCHFSCCVKNQVL